MKDKINSLLHDFEKGKLKDIETLSKIVSLFGEKSLPHLLSSLLTKNETRSFINRLLIIKKLKEEQNQHAIADKLKVGVATITRGSNELARGKFDFM